ncbi:hypothetical protein [Nocardioides rubriscoriae]|uniref:hypothetical protein n=1 Tax=Nocardioides rubriscoriae TaxID=642762 RepID=UPI0011E02163|nr:hypothetical protein [Nocardioides rubriscoriae]
MKVMTLADGSRVESGIPSIDETAASLVGRSYRVQRPDGSADVFDTLGLVLEHLRTHYGPEDTDRAHTARGSDGRGTTPHPTSALTVGPQTGRAG